MLTLLLAALSTPGAIPLPDPPALVTRIGSPAFRHTHSHPFGGIEVLGTSANGKRVYTGDFGGCSGGSLFTTVFVWDAETGKLLTSYSPGGKDGRVSRYRFTPGGLRVMVDCTDENAPLPERYRSRLLDPDTGRVIREGKLWDPPPARRMGWTDELSFVAELPTDRWAIHRTEKETALLDIETGKLTSFAPAVPSKGGRLEVSPDGRAAFAGPVDGKFRLYDLPVMKLRAEIDETEDRRIEGFTPDGKDLVVWEKRKAGWTLELWSVAGLARQPIMADRKVPGLVAFSPNGNAFAYLADDELLSAPAWEIREAKNGRLITNLRNEAFGVPRFDPDNRTIWAMRGRSLIPFDLATGQPRASAPAPSGPVTRFRFLDEMRLVGLSDDRLFTWDARTGKELSRVAVPKSLDANFGTAFAPSADRLVFTDTTGSLVSWNFRTGAIRKTPVNPTKRKPEELEHHLTTDGRLHIAREGDKLIVRDAPTGKTRIERPVPEKWLSADRGGQRAILAVSPRGDWLAVTRDDFTTHRPVLLLDLTNPKAAASVVEPKHTVSNLVISPDGKWLIATGTFRRPTQSGEETLEKLTVWDLATKRELRTETLPGRYILSARFAPDGKLLALHYGEYVLLLDTSNWAVCAKFWTGPRGMISSLPSDSSGDTLAWSPSGKLLAVQTDDERLAVWDVARLTAK